MVLVVMAKSLRLSIMRTGIITSATTAITKTDLRMHLRTYPRNLLRILFEMLLKATPETPLRKLLKTPPKSNMNNNSNNKNNNRNNKKKTVLITGIGGGVALAALQFAVALGCDVWVTSSSASKIERAVALGARGGVSYRDAGGWEKTLAGKLAGTQLDAVIDGAGGDVVSRTAPRLLRAGGVIASYGMTAGPRVDFPMGAVMRNVEIRGSTMGSRAEFAAMVAFVRRARLVPVISRVVRCRLDDLAAIEGLFADMREGRQFGKLVVEIDGDGDETEGKGVAAKL